MTANQRSKRGLINIGIVLLAFAGLKFLRSDFVSARYAAMRVRIGESEDEIVAPLAHQVEAWDPAQ